MPLQYLFVRIGNVLTLNANVFITVIISFCRNDLLHHTMEYISEKSGEKRRLEEEDECLLGKKMKARTEDMDDGRNTENKTTNREDVILLDEIKTESSNDLTVDHTDLRNTEWHAVEKSRHLLRRDIMEWLNTFPEVTCKNLVLCMRCLVNVRNRYKSIDTIWHDEVICLRDVQRKITSAVEHLQAMNEQQQKYYFAQTLRDILQPYRKIQKILFPNIRMVTANIYRACHHPMGPLCMSSIRQLPDNLKAKLKEDLDLMDGFDSKLRQIQESLEASVQLQAENNLDYLCLLCVLVPNLFGFSLNGWLFQHNLSRGDLEMMIEMLESHMANLGVMELEKEKQAYVVNLALCSTTERERTIQFVINMMNKNICSELREACEHKTEDQGIYSNILQSTVDNLLQEKQHHDLTMLPLMQSIKCQLNFLRYPKKAEPTVDDGTAVQLDGQVSILMQVLDMQKYYPQKLKCDQVTMLSAEVQDNVINGSDNQNDVIRKPNCCL